MICMSMPIPGVRDELVSRLGGHAGMAAGENGTFRAARMQNGAQDVQIRGSDSTISLEFIVKAESGLSNFGSWLYMIRRCKCLG